MLNRTKGAKFITTLYLDGEEHRKEEHTCFKNAVDVAHQWCEEHGYKLAAGAFYHLQYGYARAAGVGFHNKFMLDLERI